MKKMLSFLAAIMLLFSLTACQLEKSADKESTSQPSSSQDSNSEAEVFVPKSSTAQEMSQGTETQSAESSQRQILMTVNEQAYEIMLYDNQTADALYDLLPMELTFEDYNSVEKIAYLPEEQQLPTEDRLEGYDPEPGDLCLYAPWGNLSLFYQNFGYSDGRISLGRLESELEDTFAQSESFTVTLEKNE